MDKPRVGFLTQEEARKRQNVWATLFSFLASRPEGEEMDVLDLNNFELAHKAAQRGKRKKKKDQVEDVKKDQVQYAAIDSCTHNSSNEVSSIASEDGNSSSNEDDCNESWENINEISVQASKLDIESTPMTDSNNTDEDIRKHSHSNYDRENLCIKGMKLQPEIMCNSSSSEIDTTINRNQIKKNKSVNSPNIDCENAGIYKEDIENIHEITLQCLQASKLDLEATAKTHTNNTYENTLKHCGEESDCCSSSSESDTAINDHQFKKCQSLNSYNIDTDSENTSVYEEDNENIDESTLQCLQASKLDMEATAMRHSNSDKGSNCDRENLRIKRRKLQESINSTNIDTDSEGASINEEDNVSDNEANVDSTCTLSTHENLFDSVSKRDILKEDVDFNEEGNVVDNEKNVHSTCSQTTPDMNVDLFDSVFKGDILEEDNDLNEEGDVSENEANVNSNCSQSTSEDRINVNLFDSVSKSDILEEDIDFNEKTRCDLALEKNPDLVNQLVSAYFESFPEAHDAQERMDESFPHFKPILETVFSFRERRIYNQEYEESKEILDREIANIQKWSNDDSSFISTYINFYFYLYKLSKIILTN